MASENEEIVNYPFIQYENKPASLIPVDGVLAGDNGVGTLAARVDKLH